MTIYSKCPQCDGQHTLSQCPRWRVPTSISLALVLSGCAAPGSVTMTQAELDDLLVSAAQFGANEVLKQLDSNGCRKGSL